MAEFLNLSEDRYNVNGNELHLFILDQILNLMDGVILYVILNSEIHEDEFDESNGRLIHNENNLVFLTIELIQITLQLLKQRLKLLSIAQNRYKKEVSRFLGIIRKRIDRLKISVNNKKVHECYEIQEELKFLCVTKEELEVLKDGIEEFQEDVESVLEATREIFLEYKEAYKKYELCVEHVLRKAENKLKMSNIPRDRQEELCVLFSKFEENLTSYNLIFASSKREFEVFQKLLENDLEASSKNLNKRSKLFLMASKNAELSWDILYPIIFELLDFDCIIRGLD